MGFCSKKGGICEVFFFCLLKNTGKNGSLRGILVEVYCWLARFAKLAPPGPLFGGFRQMVLANF
jgi:hypothetical protein